MVLLVGVPEAVKVDVDHGVAAHHEEAVRQMFELGEHSSGGSERFAFQDITDLNTEFLSIAKMFFDQVGAVMDEEQQIGEAVFFGELDLVLE